ncbi:hypothetical protein M409DRAFT_65804 [Zasmidium cellare ATCC 36951]|uniref:Uncharacterized protein n=1 Tax=Zasmidium cellare ATCC 36951 TaxID=1080233 RepID=A0A6A6CN58_ZASCE|nr:uncharacterized protein M409DRAFT_65804 [Zasmidium cellare ATCC 36951]KAF2167668.1 hypothetical protein M409DRAFT_65804 [Zasmidium cellare ATCC 36951]
MESILLFVLPFVSLAAFLGWRYITSQSRSSKQHDSNEKGVLDEIDPYQDIEPLPDFDWKTTPPIKNAPLKPVYHLTMALENIPLSSLIDMDNTYLTRLHTRREIMTTHPTATIACTPCVPAVNELYTWLIKTYLPKRFPTIYIPTPTGGDILNTASSEIIPSVPPPDPTQALKVLGSHIDTDFLLLLPSSQSAKDGSPIYHLEAFVTCFPSGFSTRAKLSCPLAEIHAPVPGYTAKLEKSMDRFFARIECGRCVKRSNWSLTTNDLLFSEGGNHLYENGSTDYDAPHPNDNDDAKQNLSTEEQILRQKASVHIPSCRLRSERQTLFRLPQTQALVFAFKTYQYRLEEVKEFGDGYAERLAEAMEGLGKGNVPEMEFYKRGVVWRERVVEFLRS